MTVVTIITFQQVLSDNPKAAVVEMEKRKGDQKKKKKYFSIW